MYGQTPTLIATNTANVSTAPQYLLIGNCRYRKGSPAVSLLIDKVEWLYKSFTKWAVSAGKFIQVLVYRFLNPQGMYLFSAAISLALFRANRLRG